MSGYFFTYNLAVALVNVRPNQERLSVLKLTIGYNNSDDTYGFSGSINMFDVFFLDQPLEYTDHSDGRTYSLSELMEPKIIIGLEETNYLGKPYTDCNPAVNYTVYYCHFTALVEHIVHVCHCFPGYIPEVRKIVNARDVFYSLVHHWSIFGLYYSNDKTIMGII